MKETTNVSIAGIAFRLENDGYLLLKSYLTRLELGYQGNPDGAEILGDIEARICELILNAQPADQNVPTLRIRTIIDQLGVPDDLPSRSGNAAQPAEEALATDDYTAGRTASGPNAPSLSRRLYRNPEGAKLGGVCSGLGAYFDIEPVMVRLAFCAPVLLTPISGVLFDGKVAGFFGTLTGVFFLLYFLLWFSIPMARTPRQKLEMRGEKVTASSIQQGLRQDFRSTQQGQKSERSASVMADLIYIFGRIGLFFVKFVTMVVACSLLIGGAAIAIMAALSLTENWDVPSNVNIMGIHFIPNLFPSPVLFLTLLSIAIPVLGVSYLLMGLVLQLPKLRKTLSILFGIWIIITIFTTVTMTWGYYRHNEGGLSGDNATSLPMVEGNSIRVETIQIGDSTVRDTIKTEYFIQP